MTDKTDGSKTFDTAPSTDGLFYIMDNETFTSGLVAEFSSDLHIDELRIGGDGIIKGDGWSLNLKEVAKHMEAFHKKIVTETIITKETINNEKEETMYMTFGGTLFVMIVCIVTVKFIIPRLSLKNLVKYFIRLVYKPARKTHADAKKAWDQELKN